MIAEQMIDCFWDLSIFTLQNRSPSSPFRAKPLSWLVVPILNTQLEWKRLKLVRCVPWSGCFSVICTTNFCRWFGYCQKGLSWVYARICWLSWHLNYRYVNHFGSHDIYASNWSPRIWMAARTFALNKWSTSLRFFEKQRSHGLSESMWNQRLFYDSGPSMAVVNLLAKWCN